MRSEVKTYPRPGGEVQRVHLICLDRWEDLEFLRPDYHEDSLNRFSHIYRRFLVPACPWLFGHMVMFYIPEDLKTEFPLETGRYGSVSDPLTAAAAALRKDVKIVGDKPIFRSAEVERFWCELEKRDAVKIVSGKLPITTIIPLGRTTGYLTEAQPEAAIKVNASFFIMDRFDCATIYDQIGTVIGLCVKDGVVENPPLYDREAMLVYEDGSVRVEAPQLTDLSMEIGGKRFIPGKNASLYTRPRRARTPAAGGKKLVIVGCQVVAVVEGAADIPASGFVLCPKDSCEIHPGDRVVYRGMEGVRFGIQVGNSILRGGKKTESFRSRFYNIRALQPIPYPPSLYPLKFRKDRAARIALGADAAGKPMLLWAEGAAKLGHTPGEDSCGATLWDMAEICEDLGMVHAINLDGGGSAQLLLHNCRKLRISDRNAQDHSEAQRPVPLGLMVR